MNRMNVFARFGPHLLLVLFSVFIFAPVLFENMVFFGEEQIGFYYAISYYVHEALQSGNPMVWIANYYGGTPASLDQFVSAWYPLNRILFTLFDTFTAHHLSMTIAIAVGLIASYLFGRARGLLTSTSLMLALMYFLATTYAWLLIGTTAAHSFAILPLLLLALTMAARERYITAIVLGGLSLGVGFLAGFMQIVFYDYVIAGLYALFLDWTRYPRERFFVRNLTISYTYAAITFLGLIVGFMQFYPSASLIDLTIRTSSYAAQHATHPYPSEFISLFLPPYLSVPFFGGGSSAGFYIGVIGFISALLGLTYYRTRESIFFAAVYALIAAFAFHIPPFGWINEHLPPFSHMGGNFRWMVAAAFPIAFLGAAGIEGYLRNPGAIPRHILKRIILAILAISGTLILGSVAVAIAAEYIAASPARLNALLKWYVEGRALSFPHEHYIAILTSALSDFARAFSLTNPRFLFGTLLWITAAAIFALQLKGRRQYHAAFFVAFTLVTAGGTTMLQWNELVSRDLYAEPALAKIIRAQGDARHDYRVMGYIVGDGSFLNLASKRKLSEEEMTSLQMQTLANNTSIYFGFDRMDGMEPYRTLRHNHLLDTVIAYGPATYVFDDESPALATSPLDQLYNRDVQKKVSVEEKIKDLSKRVPLLSMMNVKYLYSPFELVDPRLEAIAHIPITAGSGGYTMNLYENTDVLPRVYAAKDVQFAATEREALIGVIREKDFSKRTWIECTTCENNSGTAEIAITRYDPGSIAITVDAKDDVWLIVSESSFPGWKATIDGIETPIYTANYLFQAIRVPRGEHHITLTYGDVAVQLLSSLNIFHTDR